MADITYAMTYVNQLQLTIRSGHDVHATDEEVCAAEVYKASLVASLPVAMNEPPPWLATFAAQMNQNLANLNAELNQSFANLNAELNQSFANLNAELNQTCANLSAGLNQISANLNKTSANLSQALANLTAKLDAIQNILRYEVPVRLAIISRAPNPGAAMGGFPPLLEPPNPRTQDELMTFTVQQCIPSAQNLGLPPLDPETPVLDRRWQIAAYIGIDINLYVAVKGKCVPWKLYLGNILEFPIGEPAHISFLFLFLFVPTIVPTLLQIPCGV
ncbi:hypothetical protein V8E53_015615 [Lactarius tabidus]